MRKPVLACLRGSAWPLWIVMALMTTTGLPIERAAGEPLAYSPDAPKCSANIDCPPPIPRRGQDPRCLEAVCHKGICGIRARNGHSLEGLVSGGEFACFSAPLVCDATGKAVVETESSRLVAIREGQHCIPAITSNNPCLKPVCRNKVCAHEPNDEGACPEAAITVTACERKGCRNGACQAVPDSKKQGNPCGDSVTTECRTTFLSCSATGTCEATKRVAENAECADTPLTLGASKRLPAAFKELALTSVTFPKYSCNVATCKLEFCGDGVINRDEECDGVAMPTNAPAGRRCSSSCKME